MDTLFCYQCGKKEFGIFINYGSYIMKCVRCRADGPATSFMAVGPKLTGSYRAIEVDSDFNSVETIFEGDIQEGIAKIKAETEKGKLIQLIKIS